MKRINIRTLGCPKNDVDSEIIAGLFEDTGYIITNDINEAEVAIINTCGFIEPAKIESIEEILNAVKLKNDGILKRVYVFGCLVERYENELRKSIPEADGFFGVAKYNELLKTIANKDIKCSNPYLLRKNYSHYAYLKISEGCSNFCSYCTIPAIKGKFRSRQEKDILNEAALLNSNGVKELIIVSQDTGKYGKDIGSTNLKRLIEKLSIYDNIKWIRLMYLHPKHVDDKFADIFNIDKVLPYLDIPVQHVSTPVLKRMNRDYTEEDVYQKVNFLRKKVTNITLRTSLIVGFPGETEADYNKLYDFINDIEFDHLGVFEYSEEEGTTANKFKPKIDSDTKRERKEEIMLLHAEISLRKNKSLIGSKIPVIIEKFDKEEGLFTGRTIRDAPEIDNIVYTKGSELKTGEIYNLKIKEVSDFELKTY